MSEGQISAEKGDPELVVLAIGGFDPDGGAGVVRDFLTARTLGAGVRLIPTAWTEQSGAGVEAIEPRDPAALGAVIRAALAGAEQPGPAPGDLAPGQRAARLAVKIGMLPDARVAGAVLSAIGDFAGPVVLDPVLRASSGGALFTGNPEALLAVGLRATLITPNAEEAAALTGLQVRTEEDAVAAGRALCARGAKAVLVKGGHLTGPVAIDVLVTADAVRRFSAARHSGPPVRGTGCALATAIAVGLGRGLALADAVAMAKTWLHGALGTAVSRAGGERHLT